MAQHIGYRFDGSYFHLSCMGIVVARILQDEYGISSSASEIFDEDFSCLHCEVGEEHPHGEEKCTHDYCGWCGDPIVLPD